MALAGSLISLGTFVIIYGLLALGLNLKFGYNGLLDIGHVAFFLIGAYTTALLVLPPDTVPTQQYARYILGLQWTWPSAVLAGAVIAGIAGMLVALPAIRLREDYLAITVLGISVIAKRTIQTETWLANGPSSLKGWAKPLKGMFPLPGGAESFDVTVLGVGIFDIHLFPVPAPVLLGAIVFGVWSGLIYFLARYLGRLDRDRPTTLAAHGLFAVLTLGVGYLASRLARREHHPPSVPWVLAGGLVVGLVATGMGYVGESLAVVVPLAGPIDMHHFAVALFLGLASLLTWALGGLFVVVYFRDLPLQDVGTGVGLSLGLVGVFVPVIVLGGGDDQIMAALGLGLTTVLLIAFAGMLFLLGENWRTYGGGGPFVSMLGVSALSLFVLRYFVLSMVPPLKGGSIADAAYNTVVNLLWLVRVGNEIVLNYARFRFLLFAFVLAGAYFLLERTVRSPFGRALKAIRDDEQVANALGKNAFRYKVQSMILGSALAGLAGGLFTLWFGALSHTTFRPKITFIALLIVVIGGAANNRGVILGAVIYWGFQKSTATLSGFFPAAVSAKVSALRLALIGALFIVILYYRPGGILGEEPIRMEGSE